MILHLVQERGGNAQKYPLYATKEGEQRIILKKPRKMSEGDFALVLQSLPTKLRVEVPIKAELLQTQKYVEQTCPKLAPVVKLLIENKTERADTAVLGFKYKSAEEMAEYCLILFQRFTWLESRL